ncbi:MAG: ubiquinol-cytochrome c reductase iron-sulfur subunit [Xanthomonadales bacterium]|nr:ubiquinol-cytochrome c reductase iron-sulfur subunit [Xanthomonadales bacterium]NIN73817.1 ubiquinol-cytochrome c reductase iron-sulfur subunit [Xanthomonadales bacterium]NIP10921.1 ubiquinol-cytochrome c reductase iron-sulfur subunit [Xanthomonadales bacterium]NIT07225.1 ubiquinol-cytochrome c reductase iron-sulfur subunit [Xanthomonadales bacterium]NIT32701.1 ubiquinol-cytochrome c reductase iron-sulfur subunit [Xanthomonadales bacterium]
MERRRRNFLVSIASITAAAGAVIASWPFLASLRPSARARSGGAPVKVDLRKIEAGHQITVAWQGKPIWVLRRSDAMLQRLTKDSLLEILVDPESRVSSQQPAYARNPFRSIRPEILVTTAICTHLGCVPVFRPDIGARDIGGDWPGGYFCPCHRSKFDFSGRVFKAVPAPTNLVIPPHRYLDDDTIEIGVSEKLT